VGVPVEVGKDRYALIIPLTEYSMKGIFIATKWEVEYTDEFGQWWAELL
jgi:hypothetical protein